MLLLWLNDELTVGSSALRNWPEQSKL